MPRPTLLPAIFLGTLLPTLPASASEQCPPDWHRICLGTCICSPVPAAELGDWFGALSSTASTTLQQWLEASHQQALTRNPQPVPLHIRARLADYFDPETLEQARYLVGDSAQFDPSSSMLYNPDVNAVTLLDVIVFRRAEHVNDNITLWAHELVHVEQYRQWGADGFARRYSQDYDSVEGPAYQRQLQVAADLRRQRLDSATPPSGTPTVPSPLSQ